MNTKCELCWETGGAFKPCEVTGKWVHSLCANWMPEIYCGNAATMQPYIISGLDKKRFNLKCNLCKNSGACIQCSFGKCTVSAHPRCALEKISGFTHRIIKDPDSDSSLWQIFCKSHAEAVKDPLKPSKKGRRTVDNDEDETPTATQKWGRKSKVDSESIDPEVKITNLSTKNRWHIFNETKYIDPNGQILFFNVNFKIDRNTGALFYQHSTKSSNNYSNIVNANGLCNKVDSTKNKF